jgi:hypothetical protein
MQVQKTVQRRSARGARMSLGGYRPGTLIRGKSAILVLAELL